MTASNTCVVCGASLTGRQIKFCSTGCKNKSLQSYEAQKERGLRRKLLVFRNKGGKCAVCGYDQNLAALTFHHTQPVDKEFKLDMRSLSNRTWEAVQVESEKCILVCANCHAELHNPHLALHELPE